MSQQSEGTPVVVDYQRAGAGEGMTKQDVAVLAVRLMGLYWVAIAVGSLGYATAQGWQVVAGRGRDWGLLPAVALPLAVYGVLGTVALSRTGAVVRRVLPTFGDGGGAQIGATARELQAVAFSVVGVWVMAEAAPGLTRAAFSFYFRQWMGQGGAQAWVPELGAAVAQVAVGLFLFLRSQGLVVVWERIRTAGVNK